MLYIYANFFHFQYLLLWCEKKKISYAVKMLKDNVQSACRYLKQSKSSLYSSFCISIFILNHPQVCSTLITCQLPIGIPEQITCQWQWNVSQVLPNLDTNYPQFLSVWLLEEEGSQPRRFVRRKAAGWWASIKDVQLSQSKRLLY